MQAVSEEHDLIVQSMEDPGAAKYYGYRREGFPGEPPDPTTANATLALRPHRFCNGSAVPPEWYYNLYDRCAGSWPGYLGQGARQRVPAQSAVCVFCMHASSCLSEQPCVDWPACAGTRCG